MSQSFHLKRIVQFVDTDRAGIVHFSKFFLYMEEVEHAFFRSLGLSVVMELEGGIVSWPRVSCSFDYQSPLHFEDEIDICLTIGRVGEKSLSYTVSIEKDGHIAGIGRCVIVCCRHNPGNEMESIAMPEIFRQKLETAVDEKSE